MIVSVYVSYNPNISLFKKAIESLVAQVDYVIVIDNSPLPTFCLKNKKVAIVTLGNNLGIAAAQNIGIRKAIDLGAEYIILSDQDTLYPSDYVSSMLPVFAQFNNACAVVPKFVDVMKKRGDGFIMVRSIFFRQFYPSAGQHEIFQAIASGKVLKVSTLRKIGLMNEDLFIDWVDLEWCWRARSRGFQIIGNADVHIVHRLGDYSRDWGFREITLRSPLRHYYITRNAYHLALRCGDLDIYHRINLFFKSFRYILVYPILSRPHIIHFKAVLMGFYHGIIGRLGRYDFL